jgi:hypothetical protein
MKAKTQKNIGLVTAGIMLIIGIYQLFLLLDYTYIGTRYDLDYKITKKQLEYLAKCVRKLQRLTKKICKDKIEGFV